MYSAVDLALELENYKEMYGLSKAGFGLSAATKSILGVALDKRSQGI